MRLKGLLTFGLGIIIGSTVTYKIIKDKYETIIDEEIESVKESLGFYNKSEPECDDNDNEDKQAAYDPLKMEKKNYENMIAYYKYCQSSEEDLAEEEHPEDDEPEEDERPGVSYERITRDNSESGSFKDNIYFISPQEYGALNDYELIDLTLYSDNILCDDMDEIVEDWDQKVGNDYKQYFGSNPDDPYVIHIRNDIYKCDYEITTDLREYATVVLGRPPHFVD